MGGAMSASRCPFVNAGKAMIATSTALRGYGYELEVSRDEMLSRVAEEARADTGCLPAWNKHGQVAMIQIEGPPSAYRPIWYHGRIVGYCPLTLRHRD